MVQYYFNDMIGLCSLVDTCPQRYSIREAGGLARNAAAYAKQVSAVLSEFEMRYAGTFKSKVDYLS